MDSDPELQAEIDRFEEQYAGNPDSLVFARLADLHRKAGDLERALEVLARGLERHPEYTSGHLVRGRCLRDLGREEEAQEAFEQVLELDQHNLVALRALAELARKRGDREGARRRLKSLLQVDPGNEEAREMMDQLSATDGPDEAPSTPAEGAGDEPDPAGTMQMDRSELEQLHGRSSREDRESDDEAEPVQGAGTEEAGGPDEMDEEGWGDVFSTVDEPEAGSPEPGGPPEAEEDEQPLEAGGLEAEPPLEAEEDAEPLEAAGSPEEDAEAASEGPGDDSLAGLEEIGPLPGEAEEEGDEPPSEEPAEPSFEGGGLEAEPPSEEPTAPSFEAGGLEAEPPPEPEEDEEPFEAAGSPEEGDEIGPDDEARPEAVGSEDPEELRARIEELAPDLAEGEAEGEPDEDLTTETLANLYEAQGFYRHAVEMYEELLEQRPDDRDLQRRLDRAREALETEDAADVPEDVDQEAPPTEQPPHEAGREAEAAPATAREQLRALLKGEAVPDHPAISSGRTV